MSTFNTESFVPMARPLLARISIATGPLNTVSCARLLTVPTVCVSHFAVASRLADGRLGIGVYA